MIDPQFTRELEYRRNQGQPPVEAEVRVLLRRKRPNNFKFGVKRSLILHAALVGFYGLSLLMSYMGFHVPSLFLAKKDLSKELSRTAIRVDVVDLPTMKLSELAKVDLTKDAKIVSEKSKAEQAALAKAAKEAAKKDQMVLLEKEKKETAKKSAVQKKADDAEAKQLADLQKMLSQNYLKEEELKKNEGEGREILAGNIKSQGYSVTGDIATQTDAFQAEVKKHFAKYWNAPGWMKASGKFSAKILVRLGPDGRVLSQEFLERSGSAEYDGLAAKAVSDGSPFPRPPADLLRNVMEDGIVCGFPI